MTTKQIAFRKNLLMKIHISETYLKLYKDNRTAWVEFLQTYYKVKSSSTLSIEDLINLTDFLSNKQIAPQTRKGFASKMQLSKIKELWNQKARDKSDKALMEFIYRITKERYIKFELLSKIEATKVIIGLSKMI